MSDRQGPATTDTNPERAGYRLLDLLVDDECCRIGSTRTVRELTLSSRIGNWKAIEVKAAICYASAQGWITADGDTLTLTAAGLAAS